MSAAPDPLPAAEYDAGLARINKVLRLERELAEARRTIDQQIIAEARLQAQLDAIPRPPLRCPRCGGRIDCMLEPDPSEGYYGFGCDICGLEWDVEGNPGVPS